MQVDFFTDTAYSGNPVGVVVEAPLLRPGPDDDDLVGHLAGMLNLRRTDVAEGQWVDNGPGWVALMLADAAAVIAVRPGPVDRPVGRPTLSGRVRR
jgi:predicted PhzF superfamily epimerase YddE/YHI9